MGADDSPTETTDLQSGIRADIEAFRHLTALTLLGQANASATLIRRLTLRVPAATEFLARLFDAEHDEPFAACTEIRKALQSLCRELSDEQVFYLSLTRKGMDHLAELGFISHADEGLAYEFVNRELNCGAYAVFGRANQGSPAVMVITSQLNMRCVADKSQDPARWLQIIQIKAPPSSDLAADREKALLLTQTLKAQRTYRGFALGRPVNELFELAESYQNTQRQTQEVESHQKQFLREWDAVLEFQKKQLSIFNYPYKDLALIDNGAAIQISLSHPPQDGELGLTPDDVLALSSRASKRQVPVGFFEGYDEGVLKIGLLREVDAETLKEHGVLTIDNAREEAVINRQRRAIKRLRYRETTNYRLLDVLMNPSQLKVTNPPLIDVWFQTHLDEVTQKQAVRYALGTQDLYFIQGPPGTGKTSVISEVVLQILDREPHARVLIASQSNVAVNHALTRITDRYHQHSKVVRIGHVEKAGPTEPLLLDLTALATAPPSD